MKFPRTLWARSFLLIVALIMLSLSSALAIFNHVQQEPRSQQTAQLVIAVVNLTRAAILSAAPEWHGALFAELSDAEGLRVTMADPSEILVPLSNHPYELQLMKEKVRAKLGEGTRFAIERNHVRALWVSFYIGAEEFWVAVPIERIEHGYPQALLLWGSLVSGFGFIGAYFIARQVARPLSRLARAANQIGHGAVPSPLPEGGAEEIAVVARAFNQMSNNLSANENQRALVLAGISHDLRTPLTRMRLAAEMSPDDLLREGLIADVEQIDEIIKQFLDYARLKEDEKAVMTNVTQLVRDITERYESATQSLKSELQMEVNCPVRPLLLKRALSNLIDNGIKYGRGEIVVGLRKQGNWILLSVGDNGPGVPPEQHEMVKRPFIRLQAARSDTTGSGLGLAIVERAAKLHGGELLLDTSPMGGLLATLRLPLQPRA